MLVAALFHTHPQDDRGHAAGVFHDVLVRDDPVRQRRQRRARSPLTVIQRPFKCGFDGLDAVALDHLEEAPLADEIARNLRAQIPGSLLRHPRIGHQQFERLFNDGIVAHQDRGRQDDALGEQVARIRRHRTRDGAADIGVMGLVGRVTHEAAGVEDRPNDRDVVEVRAGQVRIVDDDHLRRAWARERVRATTTASGANPTAASPSAPECAPLARSAGRACRRARKSDRAAP
jgi:hypothetical protein